MAARRHRVRVRVPQGAALVGGFSNPVVGGSGSLVRDRVKSDNYVAGTSGWDVEKTGQAEFQDVTVRGTIDGGTIDGVTITGADIQSSTMESSAITGTDLLVGALPNPQTHIYSKVGAGDIDFLPNDTLGSLVPGGLSQQVSNNGTLQAVAAHILASSTGTGQPAATIAFQGASEDGSIGGFIILNPNGQANPPLAIRSVPLNTIELNSHVQLIKAAFTDPATDLRIGRGYVGKFYYEEVQLDSQVIGSAAAFNLLVNLSPLNQASDYGSQFNLTPGLWTCPVSSVYTFTLAFAFAAWVSGSRLLAGISRNGSVLANQFGTFDQASTGGKLALTVQKFMAAGDVVRFFAGQVTGVNQALVLGEQSYVSVRREV